MPDSDSSVKWGFLHAKHGKPIYGDDEKHGQHDYLARAHKMGNDQLDAIKAGHVRFNVGHNGKSVFEYDSTASPHAKKHIANFIHKTPEAHSHVAVERWTKGKNGLKGSETYLWNHADDAHKTIHHTIKEATLDTDGRGHASVPDFDVIEADEPHDIVPTIGLDDRLYTEDEELVPSDEVESGRLYTEKWSSRT